jgi:hypothetical protein
MDLKQTKLTKTEWNNTEVPVSDDEKRVLKLIRDGFQDVNIKYNVNSSIFQIVKIDINSENESYLYKQYFDREIQETLQIYGMNTIGIAKFITDIKQNAKPPKKVDIMRIQNMNSNIDSNRPMIFEFILLDLCKNILKSLYEKSTQYALSLYTIIQLKKCTIPNINKYVLQFSNIVVEYANKHTTLSNIIHHAYEFIEKNKVLLKYEDMSLFAHQKELFTIFKQTPETPKLVLYIAPTGTGKTLSPIGLSEKFRVIFICVSRHVGLALAKSAISMEKKIAFAFGCETASDIRLHYFAAANYTVNKRSGGIGKVDNSNGNKVEIMICDVQSYLTAMHYMLAFNNETNIITYWDEPTITMDYPEHELHTKIHQNWVENKISKMVLSCATLPNENEMTDTINDFREKFENTEIHSIHSSDFKKTISVLNKDGRCVLPHLLYSDYNELIKCVEHCNDNKTLLRYFDLSEIIRYIEHILQINAIDDDYKIDSYFTSISDITMNSLKLYYLESLKRLDKSKWQSIHQYLITTQTLKFPDNSPKPASNILRRTQSVQVEKPLHFQSDSITKSQSVDSVQKKPISSATGGILITTNDAHTLTDGPTIFIAEDVEKIGKFYIQYSKIPITVLQSITEKINVNNEVQQKLSKVQQMMEDKMASLSGGGSANEDDGRKKDKKFKKDDRLEENNKDIARMVQEIEMLRSQIKNVNLDRKYVPNTIEHQTAWTEKPTQNAFIPRIDNEITREIMELDVDNDMKMLLLLGIGVFATNINTTYIEIMKRLAYEQKLYVIIASSDYIYGTNYSFCHGFIGKDLTHMTQQKIIQSMGRIGRNKMQQEYTIRFRDEELLRRLFTKIENNMESVVMSRLFSGSNP